MEHVIVNSLDENTDCAALLQGIDLIIHLAARVHVRRDTVQNPLERFRAINTRGSINLARQAAKVGVKRFVFMSTIGVNGSCTYGIPFCEDDRPAPHNDYSISKMLGEEALARIAAETGMDVVILRAPLVYGPWNPGNFLSLLNIITKGMLLPFDSVCNLRSLLYVGNLVDAIVLCMNHPDAAGQTYMVSDGEDVSTPELIRRVAASLGKPARLLPFPVSMLCLAGKIFGKSQAVEKLVGSLQVDSSKIRRELGWKPPFTMEQGLKATAEWYKCRHEARGNRR